MKKLYRKGTIHPSPPLISDHLSFLPAAIFTLTVALSLEDKEVLAYLISCSSTTTTFSGNRKATQKNNISNNNTAVKCGDHPPVFNCNCFRCYTSYWVRWDLSPNHQLIHEIIDAFEDGLEKKKKEKGGKKERRRRMMAETAELTRASEGQDGESGKSDTAEKNSFHGGGEEGGVEEGSVRKIVNFLGERLWGVWGS